MLLAGIDARVAPEVAPDGAPVSSSTLGLTEMRDETPCAAAERAARTRMLFGLPFLTEPARAVLERAQAAPSGAARMVVTANMDHIMSLSRDPAFRSAYVSAAVRTLDGMPLVWLLRARGARELNRVTGHDLLAALLDTPVEPAARLFLVASDPQVAAGIRRRFGARGWHAEQIESAVPPFGFEADAAYGETLAQAIRAHGTTVLLMGVGAPKSEIWVCRMGAKLGEPVVLCIGEAMAVGAGLVTRAPLLMQRLGMEWFWRFLLAPRRMFYRYFVRSLWFPWLAWRNPDLSRV